jgi:hypothetical protein
MISGEAAKTQALEIMSQYLRDLPTRDLDDLIHMYNTGG